METDEEVKENEKWLRNVKILLQQVRIWEEAVVAYFKAL
jgi:hypothetical protein